MRTPIRLLSAGMLAVALAGSPATAHDGHRGTVLQEAQTSKHVYRKDPPAPQSLGGPFELMDHTGRPVTQASYPGQWLLINFGFTGCREACPTGLVNMTAALDQLGPHADRIQPLFIDFSMEEPDVQGLAQFVENFHPRLIGLTGTRKQTFDVVRAFKVRREYAMTNYSRKETGPRINHTTYFYLVDPQGVTRAYFYHDLAPEEMAATMRRHVLAPGDAP